MMNVGDRLILGDEFGFPKPSASGALKDLQNLNFDVTTGNVSLPRRASAVLQGPAEYT
jgi:hypothetical protein